MTSHDPAWGAPPVASTAPMPQANATTKANAEAPPRDAPGDLDALTQVFEAATHTATAPLVGAGELLKSQADGQTLPYRLLRPATIEPNRRYPLVVFLHGAGERGRDNRLQLKWCVDQFVTPANRQAYPCFVVAPQCPAGQQWAGFDYRQPELKLSAHPSLPGQLVLQLIEALVAREPIDPKRLYIAGLSMGGFGTWDLVARHPDKFAAAVPICGGGDPSTAGRLTQLPIWCFHGDQDRAVSVQRSRDMIAALKAANGQPKYTEYPGVGHNSWSPAFADPALLAWLFAQHRP